MCDAVAANGWVAFRAHQKEADILSQIMRDLSDVPLWERDEKFGSAKSIQRKSYDLITSRSDYDGVPTRAGA